MPKSWVIYPENVLQVIVRVVPMIFADPHVGDEAWI